MEGEAIELTNFGNLEERGDEDEEVRESNVDNDNRELTRNVDVVRQ